MGGVRQSVSHTLPFPLSLPSPFHSPKFSDKPVGGKVRSSEGEVPRLPLQISPCSIGLSVLDLAPMYATDRQTSDTHHRLMHPPRRGHNNAAYRATAIMAKVFFKYIRSELLQFGNLKKQNKSGTKEENNEMLGVECSTACSRDVDVDADRQKKIRSL